MTAFPRPVPLPEAEELTPRRGRRLPSLRSLRLSPLARREAKWGFIFIAPWLVGFVVFTLAPMIASLVFSSPLLARSRYSRRSWGGPWPFRLKRAGS